MYEEGRNLLKEQKRDLEEMLKMEREGAFTLLLAGTL
jgi:hypothetical protein